MIRQYRFALALLALLAATLFIAPMLRGEIFRFRDHADYFQPLRFFTAVELREGRLPLWNPFNASGEPWLANPQTGVFYPPTWIFIALPFTTAYMLYLLGHLILLGWGAFLLFVRRASEGAALAGAVALMFAGPTLSLMDVQNNLTTFAWIPLALWCALERKPVWCGVTLAMAFLAGEPFFAAFAATMCVCVTCTPVIPSGVEGSGWAARHKHASARPTRPDPSTTLGMTRGAAGVTLITVGMTALTAFGLSAIQLLPFLEMLRGSDRRAGLAATEIFRDSAPLTEWLRMAKPWETFDLSAPQLFIPVVYIGVAVVICALIGWLAAPRRTLGWTALLVVAVVVGSGPAWLAKLPLTLFRYPARLIPLGAFAIIAIAVIGWDRITPNKRWVHLIAVLVLVGDLVPRAKPLLVSRVFRPATPYARAIGTDAKVLRVGTQRPTSRKAWMSGYVNLYGRRFDEFTAAPTVNARILRLHEELLVHPTRALLSAVPVGYILSDRDLRNVFPRFAYSREVSLYRNPKPWPMATVWSAKNDARAAVSLQGVASVPRAATVTEMSTSRAVVKVDTHERAIVMLAQLNAPGWHITIDGKNAENFEKNAIFRAVAVPAGQHEVVWTYDPRSLFFGAVMTLVTLVTLTVGVIVKRVRS